jgi:predicted negative regulator of RcsB-dependent stress response
VTDSLPFPANIEAWAAKNVAKLFLFLAIVVGVVIWLWWHDRQVAENAAAPAHAAAAQSQSSAASGADAVQAVHTNDTNANKIDAATRKLTNAIDNLPTAKAAVDPSLDDAARSAVCMYVSAANLPECQQLQHPNP